MILSQFVFFRPRLFGRGTKSAEERQREIEQSKYLGGDMEHTHLVKGLDYALLNQIRSEIEKQKQAEK